MKRLAFAAALALAAASTASAQCPGVSAVSTGTKLGLLARLNQPFLPSLPAVPGMPTVSPLGLISPRLSLATTFFTNGGFGNFTNNLPSFTGIALPRVAPVVGLTQGWPPSPQRVLNVGLGFVSPRVATGVQLVQGYQQVAQSYQQTGQTLGGFTGGIGGGGLFGRRCR